MTCFNSLLRKGYCVGTCKLGPVSIGYLLIPGQVKTVTTVERQASGATEEEEMATRVRNKSTPRP